MRRTLKDDSLEEKFQKDGYVAVPFLTPEEVEELKNYYFDTLGDRGGSIMPKEENADTKMEHITFDVTYLDRNIDYKKQVLNKIGQVFSKQVMHYLDDYRPVVGNFFRKEKDDGEVPLHQNWAYVDETEYASVSIWVPLVDSTRDNGTLEVVPGSHKRYGQVRGPMIRSELLDIDQEIIDNCLIPIDTKAGDAVILDDSIVHYTSANSTDGLRLAVQLILVPKEATSIIYHMDPYTNPNHVEVLAVDTEFYMQFNPWKKPSDDIKRLKEFSYQPFSMTLQEFEQRLKEPRFDEVAEKAVAQRTSFFKRLFAR